VKFVFILGTRPEVIKLYPLIKKYRELTAHKIFICSTGQHETQAEQMLKFFNLKENVDLNIMKHGQSLEQLTIDILKDVSSVLKQVKPDAVFVQGDTKTAAFGALAAFYLQIDIIHIEAGLRSFDITQPFPEEFNRRMIDVISNHHIAPTKSAYDNLINENYPPKSIFISGNTVVDALFLARKIVKNKHKYFNDKYRYLDKFRKIILITAHRRENLGKPLIDICKALANVAKTNHDSVIVFPVHLNPSVRNTVYEYLDNHKNIFLLKPLDYGDFIYLLDRCYMVITDSGGIQEEAPSFKKPVLVLRNISDRNELIELGGAILVGRDKKKIEDTTNRILADTKKYRGMQVKNPYGDGKASERIIKYLNKKYGVS
jgi:UDP-N-acetylglucosamine 2-epimerase (non-hydrolysing)